MWLSIFKRVKNSGEVPQYYIENHHPPILDKELYYAAQERFIQVGEEHKNKTSLVESPFSRKIRCGDCGKYYSRRLQTQHGKKGKMTWNCQTYFSQGRDYCAGKNILEEVLHEVFLAAYNMAVTHTKEETQAGQLADGIQTLFTRERELVVLKAKGYITKEAYEGERATIAAQIAELESEYQKSNTGGGKHPKAHANKFTDELVEALDYAETNDEDITFYFYNGASSTHKFFTKAQSDRFEYHKKRRQENAE